MNVLFLCGYFEEAFEQEIANKTKTYVENAANTFQKRLIAGFHEQNTELTVISAPFIGAWPTVYADRMFHGFQGETQASGQVQYVYFNNMWGYRNISRTRAIRKAVKSYMQQTQGKERLIVVYSPHTPFLEGAVYAKKLDPSVRICLVVPDLPQYMNLSKKAHPVYDFFKKIDIGYFMRLNHKVDNYILLTRYMAEPMQVGTRPFIVVEGITQEPFGLAQSCAPKGKTIAYAGKLNESFGVKKLIEAFQSLPDMQARLEICGGGELKSYVEQVCQKDKRIQYHGIVSARKATEILQQADVLVNPRQNDDVYTKYSFPSKNIEYLMTGKPVICYMLDGIPEEYRSFVIVPQNDSRESLTNALTSALQCSEEENRTRAKVAIRYLRENTEQSAVAEKILDMQRKC